MTRKATGKGPPPLPAPQGPPQLDPSLLTPPKTGITAGAERRFDLRPSKDGTGDLLYEGPGYTAHVRTDGSVRFDDKGAQFNRGWNLIPFMPLSIPGNPSTLQGVAMDFLARRKAPPPKSLPSPRDAPIHRCRCTTCPATGPIRARSVAPAIPVLGGQAPAEQRPRPIRPHRRIMRFNGKDPYRYDKATFLSGTRELRVGMAVRALAANVRRASASWTRRSSRSAATRAARAPSGGRS